MDINFDSRTIKKGQIFVALKGEHHDGHDFVESALKKGALKAIVKKDFPLLDDRLIKVDDPLAYLQELAKKHLEKHKDLIKIAITGSCGKTTTKEMLKASLVEILGEDKVFASFGNFNNHIGLPINALKINKSHKTAIFEMGMNHKGEIKKLCEIVNPNIGIITNIGHAHEGNFEDGILGVAKAKGELFENLSPNGIAIINLDDERIIKIANSLKFKKTISFGKNPKADLVLLDENTVLIKNIEKLNFSIPILGEHNALNALSALSTIKALNLDIKNAINGLLKTNTIKGRIEVMDGPNQSVIVNDSYNANPSSMLAGIKAVKKIEGKRYIGVIGSMGELGKQSQRHHFDIGKELINNFDILFLCGEQAHDMFLGANKKNSYVYEKSYQIVEPLKKIITPGDVIFVKGSLSQNMQVIIDELTK